MVAKQIMFHQKENSHLISTPENILYSLFSLRAVLMEAVMRLIYRDDCHCAIVAVWIQFRATLKLW